MGRQARWLWATLVMLALSGGSSLAGTIPDGEWAGRWYPGDSCRDTKERDITARVENDHITGQVHNPPSRPGAFGADIAPNGKFKSAVAGLVRHSISLRGYATASEITGKWSGRSDCGSGSFVLKPVNVEPAVPEQPAEVEPPQAEAGQAQALPEAEPPVLMKAPMETPELDERLVELDRLFTDGLITADEFLDRRARILGSGN